MNNSIKKSASISDVLPEVAEVSVATAIKPVLEGLVIEHSVEGSKNASSTNLPAKEIGGTKGPDPTRFGDWEHKGRCYDF